MPGVEDVAVGPQFNKRCSGKCGSRPWAKKKRENPVLEWMLVLYSNFVVNTEPAEAPKDFLKTFQMACKCLAKD